MNGIDLLADTNALIYLLDGNPCMSPFLQNKLAFSIISEMELLSFSGITESEENNIKSPNDLNTFGQTGTCDNTRPYFKSVQDGFDNCTFRTADGMWWNISEIDKPLIWL